MGIINLFSFVIGHWSLAISYQLSAISFFTSFPFFTFCPLPYFCLLPVKKCIFHSQGRALATCEPTLSDRPQVDGF